MLPSRPCKHRVILRLGWDLISCLCFFVVVLLVVHFACRFFVLYWHCSKILSSQHRLALTNQYHFFSCMSHICAPFTTLTRPEHSQVLFAIWCFFLPLFFFLFFFSSAIGTDQYRPPNIAFLVFVSLAFAPRLHSLHVLKVWECCLQHATFLCNFFFFSFKGSVLH